MTIKRLLYSLCAAAACASIGASSAWHPATLEELVENYKKVASEEEASAVAGQLRGGNRRRLQSILDVVQQLVRSLPVDSRFDVTSDYLAALNYLRSLSIQQVPAVACRVPSERADFQEIAMPFTRGALQVPIEDESIPTFTASELGLFGLLFDVLPHSDAANGAFDEASEVPEQVIQRRLFGVGMRDRVFNTFPKDALNTDETVAAVAFEDFGAHRVQLVRKGDANAKIPEKHNKKGKKQAKYAVYLGELEKYDVREGFARYGADAYFNEERELTHIVRLGVTYTAQDGAAWEFAKLVFKSSLLVDVTLRDHLLDTHLTAASSIVTAGREELEPSHPVRRLLTPWGFGSARINHNAAISLLRPEGIVPRFTALDGEPLYQLVADLLESLSFKTFPEQISEQGLENAYVQDGKDFYKVLRDYVDEYLDIHFDSNKACARNEELVRWYNRVNDLRVSKDLPRFKDCKGLVDVIATYMFSVSAGHNHRGTSIASLTSDVCFAPSALAEGATCGVPRSTMYTYTLLHSTAQSMPKLLNDFTFMFEDQESKDLWNKFQENLNKLESKITERNKKRAIPFYGFLPSLIEISTAV